jgi:hypothetical protein
MRDERYHVWYIETPLERRGGVEDSLYFYLGRMDHKDWPGKLSVTYESTYPVPYNGNSV